MAMVMDDLPDGWHRTTLGELGRYLNGRAFKSSEWSTSGRPIIRIQDLTGSNDRPNHFEGPLEDRYVIRPGDFLISWSATLGAFIWDGPEGVLNQHIFKVESNIDKRFHFHLVRNAIDQLEQSAHGSGMVHVTKGTFERTPVIIPSDPDKQRLIADLIDRLDLQLDSALEHIDDGLRATKQARRAVLLAACSGRLTSDWRLLHEDNNARDLVAEIYAERLGHRGKKALEPLISEDPELPDSWVVTNIASLVDVATGATPLRNRKDYYEGGTIPWVTSGAVNRGIIESAGESITGLALAETNAKVFPKGTLLVAMYGEGQTRGRVAELAIEAATNQAVAALLFAPSSEALRPYLRLFLEYNYELVRTLAVGGVQPNLSLGLIRDLLVPLPPISEQTEIVRRVDVANLALDRIDAGLNRAREQGRRSGPRFLAKALRGEMPVLA